MLRCLDVYFDLITVNMVVGILYYGNRLVTLYRTGQVGQARLFGTVNCRLEAWDGRITSKQLLINHFIVYMFTTRFVFTVF